MKKEDLRKILKSRQILKDYYGDGKRTFGTALSYFEERIVDGNFFPYPEEQWFPQIDSLKEEFEILKKEIRDVISAKKAAEKFLAKEYKCNHCVRISNYNYSGFKNQYEDTCILCGKQFYNSSINKRKNMHSINAEQTATFIGREDVTPEGFRIDREYIVNYTENNIIKILLDILEKTESEEIDIVEEIKKLNLNRCVISHPCNKILLIIGSNKQYIGQHSYITNENNIESKKVIDYLSNLYNTVIEVVGNEASLSKYKQEESSILTQQYDTIRYLEGYLQYEKDIPFSLIIDMSNLFTYQIEEEQIKILKYQLDLKNIFPNIPIIIAKESSTEVLEEIKEILKNNNYTKKLVRKKEN